MNIKEKMLERLRLDTIVCLTEDDYPTQRFTPEEWRYVPAGLENLRKEGKVIRGRSKGCYLLSPSAII